MLRAFHLSSDLAYICLYHIVMVQFQTGNALSILVHLSSGFLLNHEKYDINYKIGYFQLSKT